MTAAKCLEHAWMKSRKNNLNSSTSSLDSALCMDSPSSVEPSPASSTSSSFSPAPSSTISHSNTATTSTVTTSSSPVMPFSQPEDMSEVNKKLAHISSLATSSMSATEATGGASIKLRDDEGSPTSTASSTSTLKEAASSENITVLAGEVESSSSSSRPTKESSSTPGESAGPSQAADTKVPKDEKVDTKGVVANGKDAGVVDRDEPKVRDRKGLQEEDGGAAKGKDGEKFSVAKADIKDPTKREEEKLDMILDGIKTGVGSYSRTKRSEYDVKTSRIEHSKPYASSSDRLSNSTSQLPLSKSTEGKEIAKTERRSGRAVEEPVKSRDRGITPATCDPIAGSSSTGALIESRESSSSCLSGGRSVTRATVSPAIESSTTSPTKSSRRDKERHKSDSFDESYAIKDSSSSKYKSGKSVSQRASPTQEIPLSAKEEKPGNTDVPSSSKPAGLKEKTLSFDERHTIKAGHQDSSVEVQVPEANKEMSDRERKRLARLKRRGSVDKTIQMINKAKLLMTDERKVSVSDETVPVVTPTAVTSPHDKAFADEPAVAKEESPSDVGTVTSPTQLTPKTNNTSPKLKHRPTTPEPMSPTVTNTKLLHTPERRTRRKSEGMKPIQRRLKKMAPHGGTLQEEGSSEDDEEEMIAISSECPPSQSEKKANDVPKDIVEMTAISSEHPPSQSEKKANYVPKDIVVVEVEEVDSKPNDGQKVKSVSVLQEEKPEDVAKPTSSSSGIDVSSRPESFRRSANSSPVKDLSTSTISSASESTLSSTNELMDRGERASSRPSSRTSSRPSSRTDYSQTSVEKDYSVNRNKTSSPVSSAALSGPRAQTSTTKYTSCTANAFTSNNSPFMAEETRPYTSVLRRSESSKSKSSVSSLTRTPVEDAWRYESSTAYTPTRRLSSNPVRNRGAEFVEISGRTSPSRGLSSSSSLSRHQEDREKESRGNGKVTSESVKLGESEKRKGRDSDASSYLQSTSPVNSFSKNDTDGSKGEATKSGNDERLLGSPPTNKSISSPRRAYVKREEMVEKDDGNTPVIKVPSTQIVSAGDDATSGPSHSILDTTGPDIVVRLPSESDATSQTLPPPASSSSQVPSSSGDVVLRRKPQLSNPKRLSWRHTPVISPDVVDMILKGEIFDSDDECSHSLHPKLETCLEVNEEDGSLSKKFTPPGSRSSSRTGKHTPILKTAKPSSPENGHNLNKTSTSTLPGKKVSINENTSWIGSRETRRRKFLSTGNRLEASMEVVPMTRNIVGKEEESGTVSPLPDPLSISIDMRSHSLSRLRANSLSHSSSTPDLTQIAGMSKKESRAKRVERSNSKRQFGRVRVDTYLDATQRSGDAQTPPSPSRRSGTVSMSPKHSATSLSSRIKSSFSRWGERDKSVEIRNKGSRTLK